MNRTEAADLLYEWAGEAENGNYHDFSAALEALGDEIDKLRIPAGGQPIVVLTLKSLDAFPASENIAKLVIE